MSNLKGILTSSFIVFKLFVFFKTLLLLPSLITMCLFSSVHLNYPVLSRFTNPLHQCLFPPLVHPPQTQPHHLPHDYCPQSCPPQPDASTCMSKRKAHQLCQISLNNPKWTKPTMTHIIILNKKKKKKMNKKNKI